MVIKREILFTPANQMRTLHIYLPENYDETDRQYPVMYFFDGHNLYFNEDATYGKSWGLKEFLDGWEKEMIVVGIECSHEGRKRLDEYSPYDCDAGFLAGIRGTGEATMDWIVNELKPVIDRDYRTYYFREATGIAGSSMGGLMAVYAAGKYNRWFSKAGCISSAIGFCMNDLRRDFAQWEIDPDTHVYLSWGTEEAGGARSNPADDYLTQTAYNNADIAQQFQKSGATVSLRCQRGGHHCEADWEKLVPDFMNFLWF